MDSHRSFWNSRTHGTMWVEGEDQDVYEVESRIPLPRPFPIYSTLTEKNAVLVQTQISHVNHSTNGHLLKVISRISLPTPPYTLEHARITQTELMRESFRHNQEISELLQKQEELQERLAEEARAREQLALELHRAEGLIDGYTGERAALEEQLRQKEELQLNLEQELQVTGSRLQELEQERLQMQEERELVSRQQDAMRENAGPRELCLVEAAMVAAPEADLLEETEKLMKEKVEVQRQAEKESADLLKQMKTLEAELEEQVNRVIELETACKVETGDLQQQIQALEKQLDKNRRFLDEQAVDREHERDVFQHEIHLLEQQLKNQQKLPSGSEQRSQQVELLSSQLKEKADWCSELLLGSEQLRRDLADRDQEIDKLESRIRELEQALLASAESLEKDEQKTRHASVTETTHSTLEAQLQTEREALERKEKEISHLEEQLEQFREELENKSEEVQQLHMQLEIQRKEISSQQQFLETRESMLQGIDERDALINDLESQVECLRSEQERLKRKSEEEVEQLNAVIEKLQQELDHMERKEDSEPRAVKQYEFDEMKQRMDLVSGEFRALKVEDGELLETHRRLKERGENSEDLVETLREKTAGLLVAQAQMQALEKSAASSIAELSLRIRELEDSAGEKDAELSRCRNYADELQWKVSTLEEHLREKVAAALVSQATLDALQHQASKDHSGDKVGHLSQKIGELEASLSCIEKNHKLRKQLLSHSKEEMVQYERRMAALLDLLRQMMAGKIPRMSAALKASAGDQEPALELQQARDEALAAKKQLDHHMEQCGHLQEELKDKTETIERLKKQLEKVSSGGDEETHAMRGELTKTQMEAALAKEELNGCKENLEKLQELLQERELTIAQLKGARLQVKAEEDKADRTNLLKELHEVQSHVGYTKDELESYKSHNEKLQEDIQLREVSISKLKEELLDAQTNVDTTKEELNSYKSHNEKLQEDIQLREASILRLKDELQEAQKYLGTTKELDSYKAHNEKLQEDIQVDEMSISRLEEELQEVQKNMDTTKEELNSYKSHNEKLQEDVQVRELSISKLKEELREGQNNVAFTQELTRYKSRNEKLQEDIEGREVSISKLKEELQEVQNNMDSVIEELNGYKSHNEKLQEDIQVREMSLSRLEKALQEVQKSMDTTTEELNSYKSHNEKLQEEIQLREVTILKLKEELQEVQKIVNSTQELRSSKSHNEEIQLRELSILKMKEELQEVKKIAETTKEELRSSKSHNENLQEDIQFHMVSISKLQDELREARAALMKAADSASTSPSPAPSPQLSSSTFQPKRKASSKQPLAKGSKEKTSLSRKSAAPSRSTEPAASDASTQKAANKELEEVMGEFREKVVQMQELHAAEILDMEARHISESDALRRDAHNLEDECKALKAVIDQLRATEVPFSRKDRTLAQFKDGYTSDSSSDYSQRTGYDLPAGLQQEFRVTPEGARREPDDPVLPDRIKSLLREVHQEGMHVLSLSELPVSENDPGCHLNLQVWLKERDSLLATVESLKGLITHMQTAQVSGDSADWRAELLEAVRQVFVRERSVLKSVLYSHLELVDTSDAVIHFNQLERRLAEQDAQHREAMGSLNAADRSSLISEIHQLRGQLECLHQGARPAAILSMTEQLGGGDTDGAPQANRLLLEELKGELSQTKLELETTLISQHKHLKELDALRAEVSQKASEVDALNVQLLEESRRGRELQWTLEKERCRAGRTEESAREQLEDLNLTLEEQKSQAEQLTSTLNQERQASSRLCQQAEREKLSLHRRLRELQVQLETERAKAQEMSSALGTERELRVGSGPASQEENLLEGLHRELDDKQAQVVHLLSQMEAEKLEVLRKDEELTLAGLKSRQNLEALLEARAQLESLEAQLLETRGQLESEEARRKTLEEDKERLEERLGREGEAGRGTPSAPRHHHHRGLWRTADTILGKLHLVASNIRGMVSKTTTEITSEEMSLLQSSVDDVISMLQQSPALPAIPESAALLAAASSSGSSLTERLLRQNAELTGFVGRLTEEKNDLRNHSLRLEEELRCYRHAGDTSSGRRGVSSPDAPDVLLLSQEKEALSREKIRLEKALHQALAQVARLRGEIRTDTLREITGPEADNAALKRMYGRYLRSESFRKALIYQKKYLLLLLGGFQECEEATLALLVRMGSRPLEGLGGGLRGQRGRGLTRFRSAVRVSIALSRMRFLVKRWHKTTGLSNSSQKSESTQMGTGGRDYLHLGVDVYRDRGSGSTRGRSGRESPRSPISSAQHRFHAAGDPGLLTCAHLQSYDPDRALTDYISRLEALQRRLGSVTSGTSSSLAPLHFGLRR